MKIKGVIALLCSALIAGTAVAQEAFYTEMPPALRFSQETRTQAVAQEIFVRCVYPDTANDDVDAAMQMLIDDLAAKNRQKLPLERVTAPSYLDVGAIITRSGESVLSFLTIAEISREREQLGVDYAARAYDVETGACLELSDLFEEDSGAYAFIAQEIRSQLSAAFPGMEPDAETLGALCAEESVRNAPFTLGAARMTLTYRADSLYPGKNSLLHVHLYYPQLRDMMTAYGLRQTDNSRFRMVALTFDDGGARGITRSVLDELRNYGAQATFFIVGKNIQSNHDILLKQQDAKHSVQSHTYTHRYPDDLMGDEPLKEKARMDAEMGEITGVPPTMMRAPGGHAKYYVRKEIGYPLIQWSLAGGDSGNPHADQIAERVVGSAADGAVILLHDINPKSPSYTAEILKKLTARGFLFATVEELFSDAGKPLEENVIYKNPYQLEE